MCIVGRPATRGGSNRAIAPPRNFHKRPYLLGAARSYIILPPLKYQVVAALIVDIALLSALTLAS